MNKTKTSPPPAPPPRNLSCKHNFIHLETKKTRKSEGYNDCFKRVDCFFCEKCLEYKSKTKEEFSRDIPDWY